ncbi:MAG: hypothetical protein KC776_05595 [Myxococcales bacterium]|nr:hypothetical protein [Myxococcales bacterium]
MKWAEREHVYTVALPKVGAGLGKLSWVDDVRPLFVEMFEESNCEFVVYEDFRHEHEG